MYIDLLKAGNTITVSHPTNKNYAPTRFEMIKGKIFFFNPEAGSGEHPTLQTETALKAHFNNMLYLGFKLVIQNTFKHETR